MPLKRQEGKKIMAEETQERQEAAPNSTPVANDSMEMPPAWETNMKNVVDAFGRGYHKGSYMEGGFADQALWQLYMTQLQQAGDLRGLSAQLQANLLGQNQSMMHNLLTQNQDWHAASLDNGRTINAGATAQAQRTAADGQSLSTMYLEPTETDENIASTIGAQASTAAGKAVADLAPEINNTVKAAVAQSAQNTVGAVGQAAYGASTAQVLSEMNAAMNQSNAIMANLATAVEVLSAKVNK